MKVIFLNTDHLNELRDKNLIAFKYCDKDGTIDENSNLMIFRKHRWNF